MESSHEIVPSSLSQKSDNTTQRTPNAQTHSHTTNTHTPSSGTQQSSHPQEEVPVVLPAQQRPLLRNTLSFKLVMIFLALLSISTITSSIITVTLLHNFLMSDVDEELATSGKTVAHNALNSIYGRGSMQSDGMGISDYYIYISLDTDRDGLDDQTYVHNSSSSEKQFGTPVNPEELAQHTSNEPQTVQGTDKTKWRVIISSISDPSTKSIVGHIVIAKPLDHVQNAQSRLTIAAIFIDLAIIAIGAALISLLVSRSLRNLRAIEEVTHAVAGGDLQRRVHISSGTQTEAGMLAQSMNVMLNRIEESFARTQESENRMRRFISDASHELRTPLATVQGYSELYRLGGVSEEDIPHTMERIESEAKRMNSLVEDLLLLARLDEQRSINPEKINMTHICQDACDDFLVRTHDHPLLFTNMKGAKPKELYAYADKKQSTQVIANVLNNIIAHTDKGTHAHIAIDEEKDFIIVDIRDYGKGVPHDVRHKLFERFYRTDESRSRESGGSGLGLSIVYSIMKANKGNAIALESPGGGLTIRLYFPKAHSS
ncbi:MAG: HAMP domain-containing histidine kinase [Actinomycetaceae bacterium]|nr:HAMP domain-containing histidine kinase [Actinomycetaceae bacterium]